MTEARQEKIRVVGYEQSIISDEGNKTHKSKHHLKNKIELTKANLENNDKNIENVQNQDKKQSNQSNPWKTRYKLLLGASIIIVIGIVIFICCKYIPRRHDKNQINGNPPPDTAGQAVEIPVEQERKLGSEFDFNTKEGDIQIISVKQKYREDRAIEGKTLTTYSTRITNYPIYIISEKESDVDNKDYYDKIYECAIFIQSECFSSTDEDCTPIERLDLTKSTRRIRNIEEDSNKTGNDDKLKEIPIPFCLFNLTNNDAITSISCPQSLPEVKKKKIILDLYFFRPPGIKRANEQNMNSTITRKTEGDKKYIREINGGICDIENAQFSYCSTDMNTTTDLENNILSYDEVAIMNITKDSQNYYIKTKTTNLVDETKKIKNYNKTEYKNYLDSFNKKIKPYLKYEILFSEENFLEYYNIVKKNTSFIKQRRKLDNELKEYEDMVLKENNVLNIFTPSSGITVDVTLLNNAGLGNEFMQANNYFYLDNNKTEVISKSEESSKSLKQILKDLIILSDAGNHGVHELYQNTNITMENLTKEIKKAITQLNQFVKYKDLSDVFISTSSYDVSLKLPFVIVQETKFLRDNLEELLKNIENGGIKNNIKILNKNIYDYVEESHKIINELFNNLNELGKALSSPKSILTELSTYYLKNTSRSYSETIKEAKEILTNYYKDEFNLISSKIEPILNTFEKKINESIENELKIINNLYEKIECKNYTIKESNEEDLKNILNNLYYIKNFLKEIREKIIKKVRLEMDIKGNGYFISDYDLNSDQEVFIKIIDKALIIAKQLDNDELIDFNFDEVMKNVNSNFTNILKYMDQQKEEIFPLNEDSLKATYFKTEFQKEIRDKINDAGVQINNKIRRENNYYLEHKQKLIDEFVQNNKDTLEEIVIYLDNLFSIVKMEELSNLYEKALNSSLETTKEEINYNRELAKEYFGTLSNKTELLKILRTYLVDEANLPYCISRRPGHEVYLTDFADSITSISKTDGYISKYNIYKEYIEKSRLFINDELYPDLLSEYKTVMLNIREILQVFKNNKISDIYPDLNELSFINDHIRIIDNFYTRFDTFISDDIFNNRYIDIIESFKKDENLEINRNLEEIESCHKIINAYPNGKDYNYDLSLSFKRKKTYTCVNGVVSIYTDSYKYSLPAASMSSNYLKLKEQSIDNDLIISQFRSEFKKFNDTLCEKINLYTSKINELKQSLLNLEKETLDQKITLDYLTPIKNYVSSILLNNYGDNIINSSYQYFQPQTEEKVQSVLDDISNKWYKYYDDIYTDIKNNLQKFNSSITEFPNYLGFYLPILSTNITKNYYDSIEQQQKNEFNYTIKYYYNILLKSVKSVYQYSISKLPLNTKGFNNIIELRRKEINEAFTDIINSIKDSLEYALNFENQIYVMQVAETNFFKTNDILKNNVMVTQTNLAQKLGKIKQLKNQKPNDEFSLSAKFYSANSENGRQIEELYEQIDKKVFVFLNLEKFKQLLIDNWIFDQDEFIRSLKELLYNSDLEVKKELNIEKEKYIKSLEKEITKTYTKDDIAQKLNELYIKEIKDLEESQINEIKNNVKDILNKIKEEIINESNILKTTVSSLNKDYSVIKNRLRNYENSINQKLNETIFNVINQFNQNINKKIYTDFFEKNFDIYLSESERVLNELNIGEIKLLSNNYNIGQIIHDIIKNLCNGYKIFTKTEINSNYKKYYLKLKNSIELDDIENTVNKEINKYYNEILLQVLLEVGTNEIGITGYEPYDFNENIVKEIDEYIETKINNIKNIIETTKGSNYDFDLKSWKKMDFSLVYQTIVNNCNSLSSFVSSEKDNEKEHVDLFLKNIIQSNFDDMLENIIPSFGNDFFERIIKYNENFKITSLYSTLRYSLVITLAYYRSLYKSSGEIRALTKDLELKIYNLNNLDLVAQKRNKEVLDLLNKKVNEFILDSKDFLTEEYVLFFKNDVSIEKNFSAIVRQEILENLIDLRDNFNNDFVRLMEQYFKDKLITSYTKTMNKQTKDMVNTIEDLRESLKINIDDLFSLDPDEVLNDINNKLNNTLSSINKYNTHFDTFAISESLGNFLNYFGIINIQPKFAKVIDLFYEANNDGILNAIITNSDNYLNYYDSEEFIKKINNIHTDIEKNYIENLNKSIYNYGIEDYPNNLEKEILRQTNLHIKQIGRMLTEEEIDNYNKERIADKAIDETFKKILTSSKNAKKFIFSLEKFDEFDKIIDENIGKLNIAYKQSIKRVKDNGYEEEIYKNITSRLTELKNSTLDYYNDIKINYHELKNYLQKSINEINTDLNKCANITYITFAEKYENYTNIESINKIINENIDEILASKIVDNQGKITTVNYTISQIKKNTQFIFKIDYDEDGGIKKPRIKAKIINKSKPGIIAIKFINQKEGEGDEIERINAEINNVDFTMDISFTTASKDLNVTTFTNFESFQYSIDLIQLQQEESEECEDIELDGYYYRFCYTVTDYSEDNYKELIPAIGKTVEQKLIVEEAKVHQNAIFNSN